MRGVFGGGDSGDVDLNPLRREEGKESDEEE